MAKKIFSKNNTANSSPRDITISPMANIEDYIGTDRFGIYVHGTKGGYNDLPTEGCYHGDAWIVIQHIIMWSATEEEWLDLGILAGVQGPEGPPWWGNGDHRIDPRHNSDRCLHLELFQGGEPVGHRNGGGRIRIRQEEAGIQLISDDPDISGTHTGSDLRPSHFSGI